MLAPLDYRRLLALGHRHLFTLDPIVREAFDVAYDNINAFHAAQRIPEKEIENMKGVRCKRIARCIASVGLYVPGGTAVLPSTALMLSVPAQIAGCKTIVLATPPGRDGSICKEVLYCAKKAGVTHILKAGGAQAISAMAWGTSSCPKVEKIFGPGNQYVTTAKMILQNSEAMVSIDMPAGPSEVLVIADRHANPVHIAADLLSQAEHGPDSQVVLVIAGDGVNVDAILAEVSKQCDSLPRGEFASKALGHSFVHIFRRGGRRRRPQDQTHPSPASEPMPPPTQADLSHVSSPPASYSPASVPMPPLHQSGPSHVPSAPVSYSPPQEPYLEQLPVHSDPPDSARNSFVEFRNDRAPLVPIGDS
ncbi:histidinol dehydrogenase, chloroplastic-like [Zingiber officinale]|uniref:histidinol dehydrogenase, chloroplastic-like n=1 Tax=Zingiber officinale TaxID=94328 RepID=UPI001C4D0B75|nr:histidinol dehydrogenase, chloroplastic-like [Zingiber officinale]